VIGNNDNYVMTTDCKTGLTTRMKYM